MRTPTVSILYPLSPYMKKQTNTKEKRQLIQRIRVHTVKVVRDAKAVVNPLSHITSALTQFQISSILLDDDDSDLTLTYHESLKTDPKLLRWSLKIFEENMGDLYKLSSWGLNLKHKRRELLHPESRYLFISKTKSRKNIDGMTSKAIPDASASEFVSDKTSSEVDTPEVVAYSMFRFDMDEETDEPVLYVYELQVHSHFRRLGLGRRLMGILESIALKTHMKKVMLTVFTFNTSAMSFYRNKMNYDIDPSSPSNFEQQQQQTVTTDYEILSKVIVR